MSESRYQQLNKILDTTLYHCATVLNINQFQNAFPNLLNDKIHKRSPTYAVDKTHKYFRSHSDKELRATLSRLKVREKLDLLSEVIARAQKRKRDAELSKRSGQEIPPEQQPLFPHKLTPEQLVACFLRETRKRYLDELETEASRARQESAEVTNKIRTRLLEIEGLTSHLLELEVKIESVISNDNPTP